MVDATALRSEQRYTFTLQIGIHEILGSKILEVWWPVFTLGLGGINAAL
jgi:hypothetical protein